MGDDPKMFRKSFETSLIISSKIIKFSRKIVLCKTFFLWKKIQLKFSKSGVFWEKKCSANFLKLRSYLVYRKVIHDISAKNFKTFLCGRKSNFNFQNRGYFGKKNVPQI